MFAKFLSNVAFRGAWLVCLYGAFFLCFITFVWYIAGYTERGWAFFRTNVGFLLAKQDFVKDWVWMTAFYFHITSCILCLLVGPFQFVGYLRRKYKALHHFAGKLYIFSVLGAGVPSGFYMALFANGGLPAQAGFVVLSVLWLVSTYLAYYYVRQGNFKAHMAWTARSYALTFSAVTLRFWTPVLSLYTDMPHDLIIALTAWINWIPNLIITELIIRYAPKRL
ncbi:MAG: DUF2306 domain-containing protein [Bacteroidetes bacterium]|nr:MAG: DUF2306 domain-containing protein [Bacteroidota bacterium]